MSSSGSDQESDFEGELALPEPPYQPVHQARHRWQLRVLHCLADSGNGKDASVASPVSSSSRSEPSQLALDASSNQSMRRSRAKAAESSPDTTTKRKRELNIQAMLGGS